MSKSDEKLEANTLKAEHLSTFCEVAKRGSVSEAADALGLSQPAASRQLASLQRSVGKTLYERTAHGITLTQAGRDLLPYACSVAQALARARRFAQGEVDGEPLTLRLGLSHHLITRYTGPILKAAKTYTQTTGPLRVHLVEGYSAQLTEEILNQQLDAALVLTPPREVPPALSYTLLGEDYICLLTLPDDPIASQASIPLATVQGETLIVSSDVSRVYRTVQDDLAAAQVEPGRVLEVSGPAAVRTAVLVGQGVGVTLRSFVKPETDAGWLKCVGLEDDGFSALVSCVTPEANALSSKVRGALSVLLGVSFEHPI